MAIANGRQLDDALEFPRIKHLGLAGMRFESIKRWMATATLCVVCHSAYGTDALYDDAPPLAVTLTAPFESVTRAKNDEERPYFDGMLAFEDPVNGNVILNLGLRARGNFRRENCRFIPLQLNFKKSEVPTTYFRDQNKLKLVRACRPGQRASDWLMLEYLSYRAWALVSDHHFRTRLLNVRFVDSDNDNEVREALAFIVESDNDTAARLNGSLVPTTIKRRQLDEPHTALFELFQFFIGNSDYSTTRVAEGRTCCHNSRLIDHGESAENLKLIPYDFDHAGIVSTNYARPPDWLSNRITSVRQRYFIGVCKSSPELWQDAITRFQAQRTTLRELFDNPLLSIKNRRDALKYVDAFFEIVDDPKKVERFIVRRCRGKS